ncbi:ATP-binding cassette domain-containing protein [Sphingomonas histidinilytica]|jgi:sulfonate transport system ATP-binding protein|uniref:Sulfonate transport system ATP-binding protein n=1 Tax=Rhizorhabdus histidinilytica TaxID=439228 RepID=A0A1T5FHI4_9SPHN|nr:ABC transporter ATP-binding protein [Rhizorhabdus histidinilytica]MBO9375615.1 ATP-binding cassette domain-containing protein [Rhizorhabdus histidinilytica]SKB95609.1 sulfonate transport system ATP-binding protein [Rhizorhabdus histidinilytica]
MTVSLFPRVGQIQPVVRLRGFTRAFGETVVIDGLDLDIAPGEFVALLGHSGSGKTTLLRTLANLDQADGQDVTIPSARAVVFQDSRLLPWKRVWKNVVLGLSRRGARKKAEAALAEVGLSHRVDAWPLTLSGGEAQRTALARALVREPQLLLLDEPFAALDALTRLRMHELVLNLWRAHRPAVLLVTHDVDEAIALADRVLVLAEGRFVAEERIEAERGRRTASVRDLRRRLLAHLGVTAPSGSYADAVAGAGAGLLEAAE